MTARLILHEKRLPMPTQFTFPMLSLFHIFSADQVSCRSYVGSVYRVRSLAVCVTQLKERLFELNVELKAGVHMKALFLAGYYGFNANISFTFQLKQSRISMLIPHIYVLGLFVNVLVIFRYIWR